MFIAILCFSRQPETLGLWGALKVETSLDVRWIKWRLEETSSFYWEIKKHSRNYWNLRVSVIATSPNLFTLPVANSSSLKHDRWTAFLLAFGLYLWFCPGYKNNNHDLSDFGTLYHGTSPWLLNHYLGAYCCNFFQRYIVGDGWWPTKTSLYREVYRFGWQEARTGLKHRGASIKGDFFEP